MLIIVAIAGKSSPKKENSSTAKTWLKTIETSNLLTVLVTLSL